MQYNNNIMQFNCQEPPEQAELLVDGATGKRSWSERKIMNEYLSLAFSEFDVNKAQRLAGCSTFLQFKVFPNGEKKLATMNSCHVRLCPICAWRRSLKVYANVIKISDYLHNTKGRAFVMCTLTVRNCTPDELNETINVMYQGWNRFNQLKAFKKAFKGYYRALEITRNDNPLSKDYGTFHPHFHCLFSVNKSYFTSRDYLSTNTISTMWQESLRLAYLPLCDMRKIRGTLAKACAEVCKYSVKDSDIVVPDDWQITVDTAKLLDSVMANRRLIAYGGELAEIKKFLQLEDEETSKDLVHNALDVPTEEDYKIVNYFWFSGARGYYGF